ncbi:hypothetical protein BgiBS90_012308 [Biomphalaria glabrata]|nr:hypothetical protein BgiBS90_012308 [Biomphalaria glabrata]
MCVKDKSRSSSNITFSAVVTIRKVCYKFSCPPSLHRSSTIFPSTIVRPSISVRSQAGHSPREFAGHLIGGQRGEPDIPVPTTASTDPVAGLSTNTLRKKKE